MLDVNTPLYKANYTNPSHLNLQPIGTFEYEAHGTSGWNSTTSYITQSMDSKGTFNAYILCTEVPCGSRFSKRCDLFGKNHPAI